MGKKRTENVKLVELQLRKFIVNFQSIAKNNQSPDTVGEYGRFGRGTTISL